jgi:hypothetical protein
MQERLQRFAWLLQVNPDEWSPFRDRDRDQSVLLFREAYNSLKLGSAAELTRKIVSPTVIAAA